MTTFALGNGWTPELKIKDKKLKEKYGNSAHITPFSFSQIPESYKQGLKGMPEQDTYYFKANKEQKTENKMSALPKVLMGITIGALGISAFKKIPYIKNSMKNLWQFIKGGKKPSVANHAPLEVTDKDKKILSSYLESVKKADKYKAKSKYATELINESADVVKVKYDSKAPFAEARLSRNIESEGSKWGTIRLKDGKEVAVQYNPRRPNSSVNVPEYYTWESGGLDIGQCGTSSYDEALNSIAEGLKKHGYDSDAIINELKNLMTL